MSVLNMEISVFYVQKVYGNLYLFFSRLNTLLKETEQNYNKVQDQVKLLQVCKCVLNTANDKYDFLFFVVPLNKGAS